MESSQQTRREANKEILFLKGVSERSVQTEIWPETITMISEADTNTVLIEQKMKKREPAPLDGKK